MADLSKLSMVELFEGIGCQLRLAEGKLIVSGMKLLIELARKQHECCDCQPCPKCKRLRIACEDAARGEIDQTRRTGRRLRD